MRNALFSAGSALVLAMLATPAMAQDAAKPADTGIKLKPLLDARLRYEGVDQPTTDADAVTLRLRAGVEAKSGAFSLLAEAEGTLGVVKDYNDTLPGNGVEPYSTVADPENIELNRVQISWMKNGTGVTVGRQRIVLDNARFVGNVGFRQNEQTFDAVRGQAKLGKVTLDGTYAISQRTIFGNDSPNEHFDGDIVMLGAGADIKPVKLKAFAYLIDYDTRLAFSSQTFGLTASADLALAPKTKLGLTATVATQADMGGNPASYDATYLTAEASLGLSDFTLKAGYEELGSDGGVAAFQTPLATLHAFNGWADLFLTTPAAGLRDYYAGLAYKFTSVKALPGLNAALTYHVYEADFGAADYGSEWNASLGFKLGKVSLLAKYAAYDADGFSVDTDKLWLQADFTL